MALTSEEQDLLEGLEMSNPSRIHSAYWFAPSKPRLDICGNTCRGRLSPPTRRAPRRCLPGGVLVCLRSAQRRHSATDSAYWIAAVLNVIGFLSIYVAFAVVTSFYSGGVYKVVTLPLALISYLVFAAWPAATIV